MSSVPCTRSEGLLMPMSSVTEAITVALGKQGGMLFRGRLIVCVPSMLPERRRLPWAAVTHFEPPSTVGAATRIEHHRGTCGDHDATDFFCSAFPAHIAWPIPHRSSPFSRPAFSCLSFFWALLQLIPASCSFASSAFPFLPNGTGPSHKAPARL